MEFGPVPVAAALGMILGHSQRAGDRSLPKGRVLDPADVAALAGAGLTEVIVARPSPGDLPENEAAARLATALVPDPAASFLRISPASAGRVNLHATVPGVVLADAARIHALNALDPEVTLATLAPYARVAPGTMVATIKIITYAVPGALIGRAEAGLAGALRVQPVQRRTAALVLTEVPGQPARLAEKARRSVAARLARLGIELTGLRVVPHDVPPLAQALSELPGEMLLILTGSATSDPADTAPSALRAAGGVVVRFGMPVDPGNLLFHGHLGARPVIGLPGCARSPALNGADLVLERLACGLTVGDEDIARMGLGGLLKEIPSRPRPREAGEDHL
ncbi:molybdopterin-binding protein [Halodurantibacterium flavum]|uniref:Molybdopterin-binding protein n=1 Tax=Halodurantibacterium flavum TaxID=1382802 RepID=A0ABW4S5Q9_9RHOB